MGRQSSIKRLPKEIRELISKLRQEGRTIDEITEKLSELGADVSRSAMGRHVKHLDEVVAQVRESRAIAEALVKSTMDEPQDKTAQANIQLMQSLVMKMMTAVSGGESELDPKDVMFLSKSISDMVKASKDDAAREMKIREKLEKEIKAKTEKAVAKAGKNAGLNANTINTLKQEIFGLS